MMTRSLLAIAVLLAILHPPGGRAAPSKSISVAFDDGRAAESMYADAIEKESIELYVRANDVARIFRATQFWNATTRKVVLGVETTRFVLTVDTRVVLVNDDMIMLRNPVRYEAGFVMIPLEFILDIASQKTPLSFSWDRAAMTLKVSGGGYNIVDLSIVTSGTQSTASIRLKESLAYHMDTNTPGLVRLKVYGGRVDAGRFLIKEPRGLFNGVRTEQTERDAYIYFDIKKYTSRVRVEKEEHPPGLKVILEQGELPEIPEPDYAGRKPVEVPDETAPARKYWNVTKVVIDPGHGGKDLGKVGNSGTLEKDVNLALARAVAEVLREDLNLEVVLTREDDRLLSLTRRTEIANESGAGLFLSIHCNGWFTGDIGGFEAYFLSPAKTDYDKAVARAENEAAQFSHENGEVESDINFILWDMVQNEFISESSSLAELIQKEMNERLHIRNRGVKQAHFTVLQGARMPAVLVETAFLSNDEEERLLNDAAFHKEVAKGIGEAVRKFKSRYEFGGSE
ncbi:MAG: N-acetylmuramoyl-L-alanine amidase [Chitinivibrionia bacterium]|nr:N-acetylmuramoyl-L-alanine amidase [Chitinivibrionia bacterium]